VSEEATIVKEAEQRDTFLSFEEVLRHRAQRCLTAADALRSLPAGDHERLSLARDRIVEKQLSLVSLVQNFASRAPGSVLSIRLQYVPEKSALATPETGEAAVAQLAEVNHELTTTLEQLMGKMATPELAEEVDELRRAVTSHARGVSMMTVTTQDP